MRIPALIAIAFVMMILAGPSSACYGRQSLEEAVPLDEVLNFETCAVSQAPALGLEVIEYERAAYIDVEINQNSNELSSALDWSREEANLNSEDQTIMDEMQMVMEAGSTAFLFPDIGATERAQRYYDFHPLEAAFSRLRNQIFDPVGTG